MSAIGYAIVGISLFLFVNARSVYPELLVGRLVFALGAAATATMVTAILPSMTARTPSSLGEPALPAYGADDAPTAYDAEPSSKKASTKGNPPARLAGFVGMFTGAGALIALTCFLPLPAQFSKLDVGSADALRYTFYVVGGIALVVAVVCFFGLRGLVGEESKSWKRVLHTSKPSHGGATAPEHVTSYRELFSESVKLGFKDARIGLGYLGGFVARASSVAITLFIPLLVNDYYISSGLCEVNDPINVKKQCKEAYVLAAKLTGVSQLVRVF